MLERAIREVAWIWLAIVACLAAFGGGYWLGSSSQQVVLQTVEVPVRTPCPSAKPRKKATLRQVAEDWQLTGRLICHTAGRN